ncbi:hypothetical protein C7999DRAFT_13127 [Corynascus novoguineensis]|uniref:Rho-GAP domain-containing protein n=1 Tax=Corynascus novoguineensis TaxID=1126955 RepID=A0AAN7CXL5_9PEZI|nr:hypothetical protein C7999DRAFT_13127 [Corynascus novoguineensis]
MDWVQGVLPPGSLRPPPAIDERGADGTDDDGSISAACSAASEAIARTLLAVNRFVREVRESRSEFDGISTELHSLDGVLDLLGYDAAFIPTSLIEHTPPVLETCLALLNELEGCISLLNHRDVPRAEKRSRWLASRKHVDTLRWTLSEYKLVLGLTADLVGVTKSQANDATGCDPSDSQHTLGDDGADDDGLAVVTARILEVSNDLKNDREQSVAMARLGQYLDMLRAETRVKPSSIRTPSDTRRPHRSSSMGGPPDSAIDVSYDDLPFRMSGKQRRPTPSTSFLADPWEEEEEERNMDKFDGELNEMPSARIPPVPPRSASRMSSAPATSRFAYTAAQQRPGTADTYCDPRPSPIPSWPSTPRVSTSSSSDASQYRGHEPPYFTPVTELSERTANLRFRPDTNPKTPHSRRGSVFSQALEAVWENPHNHDAPLASPGGLSSSSMTNSGTGGDDDRTPPPSASGRQSSLFRRNSSKPSSSKLSATFRGFGRKRSFPKAPPTAEEDENLKSLPARNDATVFGVPLASSIQVAKGVAGTRHGGSSSSTHATREYPLCILRCVYHIRDCGLHVPHVFGLAGDAVRVAELRAIFSSAATGYGKELDWSRFDVHDAAALVLLFLSELPRPLISESVGKRWITMSRQAAAGAVRLDQGLDFWEEALMGVQGHGRTLFKLLLGLWGDLADAAPVNDMTAERLAARLITPLMHAAAARRQTDYMLGLAFLIRKRSEYNLAANGVARKSNAAF